MSVTRVPLFDANSVSLTSVVIAVAENQCVQIRGYNLGPGDTVQFELLRMSIGSIPSGGSSCTIPQTPNSPQIEAVTPYYPCGYQQFLDETRNVVVIRSPGYYRLVLDPPGALGTVLVDGIFLDDADACAAAASECCCQPDIPWLGVSNNPCLVITPGGPLGHSPVFDLDACCLLQSLPANPNPVLTDRLVFLSGPDCFTATIDEVFSMAVVCDSLGEFSVAAYAAGDTLVALDVGEDCKRVDAQAMVTATETPWTGTSNNPNLTITPGGVNGHAPVFDYDLCADIQATPSCACVPNTGDGVLIIQGGDCVLATWPAVDLCEQIGLLPLGGVLPDDRIPVREAGGACKYLPASTFLSGVAFPLAAPDGSCLAPSYSFATDPTTGMFYDPASPVITGNPPALVLGYDDCGSRIDVSDIVRITALNGDFIEVGASINITSVAGNNITVQAGDAAFLNLLAGAGGDVFINSTAVVAGAGGNITISAAQASGAAVLAGTVNISGGQGVAGVQGGDLALSAGGSGSGPGGSTTVGGGGTMTGAAGLVQIVGGNTNGGTPGRVDIIAGQNLVGGSSFIRFLTNFPTIERLRIESSGEWQLATDPGVLGQFITSQGPGTPPLWTTIGASPILGADGSCAAPTYSFTSSPDSGMFYDAGAGSVIIGDDNCTDFIEIGASINVTSAAVTTISAGAGGVTAQFGTGLGRGIIVSQSASAGAVDTFTINLGTTSNPANSGGTLEILGGNAAGTGALFVQLGTASSSNGPGGAFGGGFAPAGLTGGSWTLTGGPNNTGVGATTAIGGTVLAAGASSVRGGDVILSLGASNNHTSLIGDLIVNRRDFSTTFGELFRIVGIGGEWQLATNAGLAGQAIVSNGPGAPPTWQTPSGVAEPITQVVWGTGPGVDSSPFFFWNSANGQTGINFNSGSTAISFAAGGGGFPVNIYGATNTNGTGQTVNLVAGWGRGGGDGGQIFIKGGRTDSATRVGGNTTVSGGDASGTGGNGTGGGLLLTSGSGEGNGSPGNITMTLGNQGAGATNIGSAITIAVAAGNGGIQIPGNNNSPLSITGRTATFAAAPQGQNLELVSGSGGAGAVPNAPSGNVRIRIGTPNGTGNRGAIQFESNRSATLPLGVFTGYGDLVLAGYGNGLNGGENTQVPAAQTTGFVWLPRVNGAPTNTPAGTLLSGGGLGYAVPIYMEVVDAATLRLWGYNTTGAAWQSVDLT